MLVSLSYLKLQNSWPFLQSWMYEVHKCLVKMEKALKFYSKIFWERDHIDRTLVTVSCHHCSIFILIVIVNLLLYLTYKLKFTLCKSRKNLSTHRVWYYPWSQASAGDLGTYPPQYGATIVSSPFFGPQTLLTKTWLCPSYFYPLPHIGL